MTDSYLDLKPNGLRFVGYATKSLGG
jgi:hypothetical protein